MNYDMLNIGTPWNELLSLSEAAEIWKIDESTIRKAIAQGRLGDGDDCRKFGKQWVITVSAMSNLFGRGPWSDFMIHCRAVARGIKS